MSKKSLVIASLVEHLQDRDLDARYLGFFECFNRGLFYEAHDVLEDLWLANRSSPNFAFYKGLIQLAGAFVHLQKQRLRPAAALFNLAQTNLGGYPATYEQLNVAEVRELIAHWLRQLEANGFLTNPLKPGTAPRLALLERTQ